MSQKICGYAICKNELKFVDQWLDNMSEADYIVILDTGSTDGTYEKLKQDSRVTLVKQEIITPWRFDVARNKSMELIPDDADILVCTDFDELFEPGWATFLRENWDPAYHNRCRYTYAWSHGELGEPQFVFMYDKIHTRDLEWKFPVHEVLWRKNDSYEDKWLEAGENIYLHHWQDKDKPRSNYLDLLKLAVDENPNNSHIKLLYGREYLNNGDQKTALKILFDTLATEDIEYADEGRVLYQTLHFIALCYFDLGNYDEAIWYCQEFIRVNPTYREPYFLMARALIELKLNVLVEGVIDAGLKYSTYKKDWVESGASWSYEDKVIMGAAALNLQDWDKAQTNLKQALEFEPNNIKLLKQYIYCLEHKN